MKLAPKILAPILGLALVLVGTVCLAFWLQERIESLDMQEVLPRLVEEDCKVFWGLSRAA